jgi:formylglycine-generating enzyme required for sulfatase activity
VFETKNRMFLSVLLLFPVAGSFVRVSSSETIQFKENKTDVGTFVQIPPGEVVMGSESGLDGEKPVHKVRITKPFEIGKYEVTQEQWQAVMGNTPSHFKGADMPVEMVSWNEFQDFLIKLNTKRDDGYIYRLPTEAEWEYACRAGSTGDYAGGLDEMAWYDKNSGGKSHPVGQKKANAWGLHDMHGNVSEWCSDWYLEFYYRESPRVDPTGPISSPYNYRLYRGGDWNSPAENVRSASRAGFTMTFHGKDSGFRLVRTKL